MSASRDLDDPVRIARLAAIGLGVVALLFGFVVTTDPLGVGGTEFYLWVGIGLLWAGSILDLSHSRVVNAALGVSAVAGGALLGFGQTSGGWPFSVVGLVLFVGALLVDVRSIGDDSDDGSTDGH